MDIRNLAVGVALGTQTLALLPLAAALAALGSPVTVGAAGTEALCFIPAKPPACLALAALVARSQAELTLGRLTHQQGHQGALC